MASLGHNELKNMGKWITGIQCGGFMWSIYPYFLGLLYCQWCNYSLAPMLRKLPALIVKFMGPAWGTPGANRTQVGPMLATWTLLSGLEQMGNWLALPTAKQTKREPGKYFYSVLHLTQTVLHWWFLSDIVHLKQIISMVSSSILTGTYSLMNNDICVVIWKIISYHLNLLERQFVALLQFAIYS